MINERQITKDFEEAISLIKALSWHLHGDIEEEHMRPQSRQCPRQYFKEAPPKYKPRASSLCQPIGYLIVVGDEFIPGQTRR